MKTPSVELFELIKKMTQSEKRYFAQYAQRQGDRQTNQYYQLFKTLDSQTFYDETAAKSAFPKTHFAALKRHLYDQILDCLHQFHEAASVFETLKKDLHVVQILMEKDLLQQAEKRLERVKQGIERYELPALMPEWSELADQLAARRLFTKLNQTDFQQRHDDLRHALQQCENHSQYRLLSATVQRWHYQKISSANLHQSPDFERVVQHPLLIEADAPKSRQAALERLRTLATLAFMQGNLQNAYRHNAEFLEIMEANPDLLDRFAERYVSTLHNFLIDSLMLAQYDTLTTGIAKLRNLLQQPRFKRLPNLEFRIFRHSNFLQLNRCLATQDFAGGVALIPSILAGLERYDSQISLHHRVTFFYLFAYCYFEVGRFSDALTYLHAILQIREDVVSEIFEAAHLLQLATHFELNNTELVGNLLPTTRRFIRQKRQLSETENALLTHLNKLQNTPSKDAQNKEWQAFYQKIQILKKDKSQQRVFNYFDWERWADRHLNPPKV